MSDHGEGPGVSRDEQKRPKDAGDVVALHTFGDDLRFPALTQLERYWQDLRGSRLVPARSEVDPRHIEDVLDCAFIVERIAPGMARFRVAGMHLSDLMGMEVRGMPLSAFFTPDARRTLSDGLEHAFDDPAVVRLSLQAETSIGRPEMEGRLLLLPLKSDFGDVSRALGCMVTRGATGRTPRRFEITDTQVVSAAGPQHAGDRRIGGWSRGPRTVAPGVKPRPGQSTKPALREMAEAPAPFAPKARPSSQETPTAAPRPPRADGRPKLYVVSNND
ncbi:MAG: PAS domain-containing protein [Pseudomonadota bacterium]